MSGPKFQRGDILHTFSPHTDEDASSKHWGLVVGDPLDCHGEYVCVQIVTRFHAGRTNFRLEETHAEFSATGLDHSSTIRCHKLYVVSESRVRSRLGLAGPTIMAEVCGRIRAALQL
jgi:mRNA-degrading endonuclease toxin of MazEF toxin-antitoxin module